MAGWVDQVEEIFSTALEQRKGEERLRFVRAACADDPSLLRRVLALLDAHDRAGDFLETPFVPAELAITR